MKNTMRNKKITTGVLLICMIMTMLFTSACGSADESTTQGNGPHTSILTTLVKSSARPI